MEESRDLFADFQLSLAAIGFRMDNFPISYLMLDIHLNLKRSLVVFKKNFNSQNQVLAGIPDP